MLDRETPIPAEAKTRLLSRESVEDPRSRTLDSRVYTLTETVEYLDKDGNPTGRTESRERRAVVLAPGCCVRHSGGLEPADPTLVDAGRNGFEDTLSNFEGLSFAKTLKSTNVRMKGVKMSLQAVEARKLDGERAVLIDFLSSSERGEVQDGDKLVFSHSNFKVVYKSGRRVKQDVSLLWKDVIKAVPEEWTAAEDQGARTRANLMRWNGGYWNFEFGIVTRLELTDGLTIDLPEGGGKGGWHSVKDLYLRRNGAREIVYALKRPNLYTDPQEKGKRRLLNRLRRRVKALGDGVYEIFESVQVTDIGKHWGDWLLFDPFFESGSYQYDYILRRNELYFLDQFSLPQGYTLFAEPGAVIDVLPPSIDPGATGIGLDMAGNGRVNFSGSLEAPVVIKTPRDSLGGADPAYDEWWWYESAHYVGSGVMSNCVINGLHIEESGDGYAGDMTNPVENPTIYIEHSRLGSYLHLGEQTFGGADATSISIKFFNCYFHKSEHTYYRDEVGAGGADLQDLFSHENRFNDPRANTWQLAHDAGSAENICCVSFTNCTFVDDFMAPFLDKRTLSEEDKILLDVPINGHPMFTLSPKPLYLAYPIANEVDATRRCFWRLHFTLCSFLFPQVLTRPTNDFDQSPDGRILGLPNRRALRANAEFEQNNLLPWVDSPSAEWETALISIQPYGWDKFAQIDMTTDAPVFVSQAVDLALYEQNPTLLDIQIFFSDCSIGDCYTEVANANEWIAAHQGFSPREIDPLVVTDFDPWTLANLPATSWFGLVEAAGDNASLSSVDAGIVLYAHNTVSGALVAHDAFMGSMGSLFYDSRPVSAENIAYQDETDVGNPTYGSLEKVNLWDENVHNTSVVPLSIPAIKLEVPTVSVHPVRATQWFTLPTSHNEIYRDDLWVDIGVLFRDTRATEIPDLVSPTYVKFNVEYRIVGDFQSSHSSQVLAAATQDGLVIKPIMESQVSPALFMFTDLNRYIGVGDRQYYWQTLRLRIPGWAFKAGHAMNFASSTTAVDNWEGVQAQGRFGSNHLLVSVARSDFDLPGYEAPDVFITSFAIRSAPPRTGNSPRKSSANSGMQFVHGLGWVPKPGSHTWQVDITRGLFDGELNDRGTPGGGFSDIAYRHEINKTYNNELGGEWAGSIARDTMLERFGHRIPEVLRLSDLKSQDPDALYQRLIARRGLPEGVHFEAAQSSRPDETHSPAGSLPDLHGQPLQNVDDSPDALWPVTSVKAPARNMGYYHPKVDLVVIADVVMPQLAAADGPGSSPDIAHQGMRLAKGLRLPAGTVVAVLNPIVSQEVLAGQLTGGYIKSYLPVSEAKGTPDNPVRILSSDAFDCHFRNQWRALPARSAYFTDLPAPRTDSFDGVITVGESPLLENVFISHTKEGLSARNAVVRNAVFSYSAIAINISRPRNEDAAGLVSYYFGGSENTLFENGAIYECGMAFGSPSACDVGHGNRVYAYTVMYCEHGVWSKTAQYNGGSIQSLAIADGGVGYTSPPSIKITDSTSTVTRYAQAVAEVTGGVITAVHITDPGEGYSSTPTVTVTGTGANAILTATTGSSEDQKLYIRNSIFALCREVFHTDKVVPATTASWADSVDEDNNILWMNTAELFPSGGEQVHTLGASNASLVDGAQDYDSANPMLCSHNHLLGAGELGVASSVASGGYYNESFAYQYDSPQLVKINYSEFGPAPYDVPYDWEKGSNTYDGFLSHLWMNNDVHVNTASRLPMRFKSTWSPGWDVTNITVGNGSFKSDDGVLDPAGDSRGRIEILGSGASGLHSVSLGTNITPPGDQVDPPELLGLIWATVLGGGTYEFRNYNESGGLLGIRLVGPLEIAGPGGVELNITLQNQDNESGVITIFLPGGTLADGDTCTLAFSSDLSLWLGYRKSAIANLVPSTGYASAATIYADATTSNLSEPEVEMWMQSPLLSVLVFGPQHTNGRATGFPAPAGRYSSAAAGMEHPDHRPTFRTTREHAVSGSSRLHPPPNHELYLSYEAGDLHADQDAGASSIYPDAGYHQTDSFRLAQSKSIVYPRWLPNSPRRTGGTVPPAQNPPRLSVKKSG